MQVSDQDGGAGSQVAATIIEVLEFKVRNVGQAARHIQKGLDLLEEALEMSRNRANSFLEDLANPSAMFVIVLMAARRI